MLILSLVLALDLRLELVRESLTGTHYRYRQYVDGQPVVGAEANVTIRPDGTREESVQKCSAGVSPALRRPAGGQHYTLVNVDGVARPAREEIVHLNDFLRMVRYVDLETSEVIREEHLYASKAGRVFYTNPVTSLNDPTLQDQNNSAAAVPAAAYATPDLLDVRQSGPLGGPYVQIVDTQEPTVAPADASSSLMFDRSQSGFEDVNAYYHVDQTQRYLQKLGYAGNRSVAAYPIEIDTHAANGADNSFFISTSPGRGILYFGDGGTDDAEDSDLVIHEYAHAIHDWISPGTFFGPFASQARAVSEGFGDYWAFSETYEKIFSGRDPFCFADWDARCANDAPQERCGYPPGADCLRRLDSAKTIADFVSTDTSGTEHRNGEIWSSALREIFLAAGKRTTDTIVIESFFGAGPNPSFAAMARRMIAADRILNGGANSNVICAAMIKRGILSDCLTVPRGELTFFQAPQRGIAIPDNDPAGVTLRTVITDPRLIERLFVNVNIAHESRGDLRIVLIAPDGSELVLQEASLDRTRDVNAIYGRDTIPAQPLDTLRGREAAGEWKLRVSDLRALDRGTVMSWSLVIQFAGDVPLAERPSSGPRQVIAAATHAPGANGTFFVTDLRLFNRQSRDVTATLIFGRSGPDFAAVNVVVPLGQVVALDDVIGVALQTAGGGQLEIQGDVIATSRTYTRSDGGTFGQFIPAVPVAAIPAVTFIPHVQNSDDYRSNVGFAEVSGASGSVDVVIFDAFSGSILSSETYAISPFGHLQIPVRPRADQMTVEIRVSGGAQVLAYASVIDNRSGDPMFVPAKGVAEARISSVPVIRDVGANDTFWRSDVWVTGIAGTDAIGRIVLTYSDARGGTQVIRSISAPTGRRAFVLKDVLINAFQRRGIGLLTLVLPPAFIVTSRTFTDSGIDTGTFGQFIPLGDNASSGTLDLIHVESSRSFRTNIGLWSPATATARVTIFDSAGEAVEQHDLALLPLRLVQFPVTAAIVNGRARIEVLSGLVTAYASIIDNVSGDPIFVPAQ